MWQSASADDPRRRDQRHTTDSISCDIGEVIDLSRSGARITCKGKSSLKVGQVGMLQLRTLQGSMQLSARAVWMNRLSWRRYEFGVEFINIKPGVASAVESLAKFGFIGNGTGEGSAKQSSAQARATATFSMPDYYSVLGVPHDASDEQIRNAFRKLARKYHPDVTRDQHSQEKFIEVQQAYEVLRDPKQRKMYDVGSAA